eukprot:GHVR01144478.1.p1 GENE.GHVR01144478.1~~GHVR01144478.1.p1  ORF type:complete len:272 (-),score=12.18 GHVR01144478.1:20-835(-)
MIDEKRTKPGFKEIAKTLAETPGGLMANIPDNWRQGRTAYGGLTAALALEAAYHDYPDLPPLRSVNVSFIGPVPKTPIYKTKLLRQGRNVTFVESNGYDENSPVIATTLAFGASRSSDLALDFLAPDAPSPNDCELYTPEEARPFVPVFFNEFDTRLIAGSRPMAGAKEGYIRTWSRHKHRESRGGVSSLLCIGDVLPPAAVPLFARMGPVSSMTWVFNILSDNPTTEEGWWHIETRLTAAQGGYSSQIMRVWNTSGELVAEAIQSVTIFV